jgi:membrane protein
MATLWTRAGLTWRQLGVRLWRQVYEDELLGRCAELAYFFLFSVFPLLLFMTALLGYIAEANPRLQESLFRYVARVSPSRDVTALINHTLTEIRTARTGTKLYLSLAAALWVASNGMLAVSRTLNIACGLKETRPWWRRRLTAVLLTLGFAVLIVSALFLIFYGAAVGETIADRLGVGVVFSAVWHVFLRWPLILAFVILSFEMVYNYAPDLGRTQARSWGSPGAVLGVGLWLLASFGLRIYLEYFHSYTTAYGSLGVVIVMLVWFYFTAFAILMGGELNSEISRELALQRGEKRPRESRRRRLWHRLRGGRRASSRSGG